MGLPGYDPAVLLEWMTFYHRPLSLHQEAYEDGGNWVVVDNSTGAVLGSGESSFAALSAAYKGAVE